MKPRFCLLLALCALQNVLRAHGIDESESTELAWATEPFSLISLALAALLYIAGFCRVWRHSNTGRRERLLEASAFAAGWAWLVIALISPLHPLGAKLFSAHMTQHEILMLIAAPLLVLGRPIGVFLSLLNGEDARRVSSYFSTSWISNTWRLISRPFSAWLIHSIALWVWHIPFLFEAAIENEWVHAAQHAMFLFSALLFWWSLMESRRSALTYGLAVLYMFVTALHSGLLGAILTFSTQSWYPAYVETTHDWGMTPLQDQQLGGLIMWIPAGLVYIFAGLMFFAGWLRHSERHAWRLENSVQSGV